DLRSWSFISRMGGIYPWESDRWSLKKCEDSIRRSSSGERSQVWGDEEGSWEKVPGPDAAAGPITWEPERDCICLRSVGDCNISRQAIFRKWRRASGNARAL